MQNENLVLFYDANEELSLHDMRNATAAAKRATIELASGKAATEVLFFGGRRGSGKTYACGKMVEGLLEHDIQVIVIDVVGTWWGLRCGADGDPAGGFDIPVIGGDHGDIDIVAEGGIAVAHMLADTRSSAVLDLSNLRKGARQRFLTDWAEEFFHLKKSDRSPVHIVFEESHTIVPQRINKGQERMFGAMEDLVRLGRNYGIGVSMLDQRPQSVNKEVLNQAEVICAFQLTGAQERDAIRRWAEAKELPGVKAALSELASLPRGRCILWSPEWLKFCGKVDVAPKKTFDASATPNAQDRAAPSRTMREIDLHALQLAMQRAAAGGKSVRGGGKSGRDNPDRTDAASGDHARPGKPAAGNVAESQDASVGTAPAPALPPEPVHDLDEVLKERNQLLTDLEEAHAEMWALEGEHNALRDAWTAALAVIDRLTVDLRYLHDLLLKPVTVTRPSTRPASAASDDRTHEADPRPLAAELRKLDRAPQPQIFTSERVWREEGGPIRPKNRDLEPYLTGNRDASLTKQQVAILNALAHKGPLIRKHALIWAGYARSGSTDKAFAALQARDLVVVGNFGSGRDDEMIINGNGAARLGSMDPLTPVALSDRQKVFLEIIAQFGPIARKMILLRAGLARSGATDVDFATLRKLDLVEENEVAELAITELGIALMVRYTPRPHGKAFYTAIIEGKIGTYSDLERDLLQCAWEFGSGADRKDLLAGAGRKRSGSTDKAFARLERLGLLVRTAGGNLKAASFLYDR